MIDHHERLITTNTLARLTGTSKSTWEKMRTRGEGPQYIKVRNLVWYRWLDVQNWLAAHQVQTGGKSNLDASLDGGRRNG